MKPEFYSYRKRTVHGHPKADPQGHVLVHVLVVEKALGKPLPPRAVVHHVDEDHQNNANRNLVICQDQGYHKLLHYRARIVRAGGNPNTDKFCADCNACRPLSAFNARSTHRSSGKQSVCRECQKTRWQRRSAA